ncbi:MAG: mannose-1-phosphate guanyltransferase [Phycisphaerae bacterium]|nr:mannose-1-phosphate guanyltransferase [Phycisphaerae bacterium]
MRFAMIMAGGAGTRLWPMSRSGQPKQLIRFIHDRPGEQPRSLLEVAATRLEGVVPPDRRYICTGERYRSEIRASLPTFDDEHVLGEPEPRDTVNAVGFAAAVFSQLDPEAVFAVLTADHLITPQDRFARAIDAGFRLVENNPRRLVSFGIQPTYPATGFGYIENADTITDDADDYDALACRLARFVEKPPLEKATEYVASGSFSWNAGMFVFQARTFLDLLARHQPACHEGLARIGAAWNTPDRQKVLDDEYPKLTKISVDYGVMEPAMNDDAVELCGVRMDVDWLDVGSWPSYGETLAPDDAGNRVAGAALAAHQARDNVVIGAGDDHTVALVGCDNLIVVRTPEATLVMPKDRAQDLKALHATLPSEIR